MKIAIVYDMIYPFNVGGAEIRNYQLAVRLARNHEVHLFGVKLWDGPDIIKRDGLTLHGVCRYNRIYGFGGARTSWEPIKFAIKLFWPLFKEDFDIIDTSSFVYFHCFTCKAVSFFKKIPLVFTWHQYWDSYWQEYIGGLRAVIGRIIEKIVSRLTIYNIAVSRTTKNDLIAAGIPEKNILVNFNGVDFATIQAAPVLATGFDLLFVGRLIHQKNISLLIEAVAILKRDFPRIKIGIIGDGPKLKELFELSLRLGLGENVCFLGFLDRLVEVYSWMKSSKVFVLPSLLEGFGIVVVEANACGLPVVVVKNKWNAAQELIIEGKNGLIVKNNPLDLADSIKSLLVDEKLRENISTQSAAIARQYDWDDLARELEKYYFFAVNDYKAKNSRRRGGN